MSIKIYNVMGIGLIVGEKILSDDNKIYLKYPAMLVPEQQTQQGVKNLMIDPIPNVFAGKNDMLKRFPIKKDNINYSGKPTPEVLELYLRFASALEEQVTGIKKADNSDLAKLPRNGK